VGGVAWGMAHRITGAYEEAAGAACKDCAAQQGTPAREAPHQKLQMVASVETESGTREEFVCKACGQRMQRFKAKQAWPPPSDVWRIS
jgi:hypothetical protein